MHLKILLLIDCLKDLTGFFNLLDLRLFLFTIFQSQTSKFFILSLS